jgi:nitrite reductase (NO-forming)
VVIVSPKEGYPTDDQVDKEFAVVQSEFYLKQTAAVQDSNLYVPSEKTAGNTLYELDYDAAMKKQPSIVAFNGHQNALMNNPLVVEKGDRVRLYMLNVGPNDVASTHVIGAIFDRVWYEGNLENEWRGMQTVLLGASNGAVMEFIVPEEGHYVLVDHEMADAEKGAKGLIITKSKSN